MNNRNKVFVFLLSIIFSVSALSKVDAPLLNKSIFGASYDVAFAPKVARYIGKEDFSSLYALHRFSLTIMYPYYRYLSYGASFDYTYIISNVDKDTRLSLSKEPAKIATQLLGVSGHIRPGLPFTFTNADVILYAQGQFGLGTSSPIAFGTQPLVGYKFENTRNMPTPFPLAFEITPKIGVDIFAYKFMGIDVGFGYRTLWIVHPMVSIPKKDMPHDAPKDKRKAIWNDVSAFFVHAGIKFAF